MPTEQEELRLTITLVDQASGGLESIKAHWAQLTTGPAAAHMETFRRKQSEISEQIKKISEAATGGEKAMLAFVGKMGLAGFAVAKLTELAGEGVKALAEYDASVTSLANRARAIGVSSGVLKGIEEQMETFGISVQDADRTVKGLNEAIGEMSLQGNQRRQKLIASALDEKEMAAFLDNLQKQTSETDRLNAVRVEGEKVYNDWLEKTNGNTELALAKEQKFYEDVGTDARVMRNLRQLHEITQAEIDLQDKRDKNAAIQLEHIVALRQEWQHWTDDIKDSFAWLTPWIDTLREGIELARVFDAVAGNTIPELLAAYQRALGQLPELTSKSGKAEPPPGAPGAPLPLLSPGNIPAPLGLLEQGSPDTGRDYFHTLKENTSQLKKLNDKLDVTMATRGGGISGPGGGLAPDGGLGGGGTTPGGGTPESATPGGGMPSGGAGLAPDGGLGGGALKSIGPTSSEQFGQLGGLSTVPAPNLGSIAGQGFAEAPLTTPGRTPGATPGGSAAVSHAAKDTSSDAALIRKIAKEEGIDPETAVAVARSEGLGRTWAGGDKGSSFGPLQAHFGGMAPGMMSRGQGDAMAAAGIDAKDPANKEAVIRWQLHYAKQHGWGEWYGAKRVGIARWQGLRGTATASREAPEEDRRTIDTKRVKTVKVEATGKVGVNISHGQDVTLGSKRQLFKPTAPERQSQMIPAQTGPTAAG